MVCNSRMITKLLCSLISISISPLEPESFTSAPNPGKTTLLRILAGKHMVGGRDVVRVLNCSAFHDTGIVCSGDLAYLGESWSKTVGSAESSVYVCRGREWVVLLSLPFALGVQGELPLQGDFSVEHMIFGGIYWTIQGIYLYGPVEGVDPIRRDKLIELLDIDLHWRMHKFSDGQRRRVQICMGLLHPYKRGAAIVYATHIFDGLETWATDLVYVQDGVLKRSEKDDVDRGTENLL